MSPWWHSQPPAGPAPQAPLPVPPAARTAAARAVTYLAGQGITDPVDIHAIARLWTTQEWRDHLSCTSTGCRCDSALHDPATAPPHQPTGVCGSCGGRLPSRPAGGGYHAGACEPTTCTCPDGGNPDGLGECGWCRRLVLTHSWHEGRPS